MKQTVLIADDDINHRKLLRDVLQAGGYDTLAAENGERAIEIARSTKPSLILMDIQMPMIDGLSAVRALKADPATRLIPVIAITALAMREDWKRITEAGFDGYLSKPINIKEVRDEVNRFLSGKPQQPEGTTA